MLAVGDEKTALKICESFLKRSSDSKANLVKAFDANNYGDLRRHAHSLKGACGYVCSETLRNSALALQLACDALKAAEKLEDELVGTIGTNLQTVYSDLEKLTQLISEHVASKA